MTVAGRYMFEVAIVSTYDPLFGLTLGGILYNKTVLIKLLLFNMTSFLKWYSHSTKYNMYMNEISLLLLLLWDYHISDILLRIY